MVIEGGDCASHVVGHLFAICFDQALPIVRCQISNFRVGRKLMRSWEEGGNAPWGATRFALYGWEIFYGDPG
jgi:hypothetical protein